MQAWASILGSALRKSLPRSTLAHLWKQWIESTAQSPWEAEVERGGRENHDCFIYTIHSGQFQVRWGSMANLNFFFFLPKKSTSSWHTNVSFELDPVMWFWCVNVLKYNVKTVYWKAVKWNSTGFWPCSVPRRHQHFSLGHWVFTDLLSPETQALVTHLSRHLLSVFHVPGTVQHGGCLVVQWRGPSLMEFTI